MRVSRILVVALAVVVLLVGVGVAATILLRDADGGPGAVPGLLEPPAPRWVPPVESPPRAEDPGPGMEGLADAAWVTEVGAATGIPPRQLAAYAGAALAKESGMPECSLSWTTLAAIGAVESDHGRHDGSTVDADGDVTPPIYGVALDGGDTALIPDSDDGELDGDAEFDRAVGPLQFIPEAWRNWHVDANADGVEDPQNIDDAALAAANYLCRASSPQDTEAGWRSAIAAYNPAPQYLDEVAGHAASYADAAG